MPEARCLPVCEQKNYDMALSHWRWPLAYIVGVNVRWRSCLNLIARDHMMVDFISRHIYIYTLVKQTVVSRCKHGAATRVIRVEWRHVKGIRGFRYFRTSCMRMFCESRPALNMALGLAIKYVCSSFSSTSLACRHSSLNTPRRLVNMFRRRCLISSRT